MPLNAFVAMFNDNLENPDDVPPEAPSATATSQVTDQTDPNNMAIVGQYDAAPFYKWTQVHAFDHMIKQNNHGNFTFVKDVDACSPDICYYASAGKSIKWLKFVIVYADDTTKVKMCYRFRDAKITVCRPHNTEVQVEVVDASGTATTDTANSDREYLAVSYKEVFWDTFDDQGVNLRSSSWSIESTEGTAPT